MRKPVLLVVGAVLLPAILGMAWFVGRVFEFEYPYFFQIRQARMATTPGGLSAETLLARSYPGERLHWHMCSYCYDRARPAGDLDHVQVRVEGRKDFFLDFAFHRDRHQLVPMTAQTASLHPDFMPRGDHLVPLGSGLGTGESFMVPSSWRTKH